MTKYEQRLARGRTEHGEHFDSSALDAVDDSIKQAFQSGARVIVRNERYDETRRGRVSTTTGWRPAFLLMHRVSDHGSSDVLGPDDRVVGVVSR